MQNCKYIEWYVLKTFLLRDIEEHSKTPQDVIDELDAEEAAEKAATQNISEIQIFNSNLHPEFGNLRTLTIDGEPWFVGKDVADNLGYQNGSRDILFVEIHLVPTSHLQYSYIIKIRRRNRHEKESQKISGHSSCCNYDILTSTFSISGN